MREFILILMVALISLSTQLQASDSVKLTKIRNHIKTQGTILNEQSNTINVGFVEVNGERYHRLVKVDKSMSSTRSSGFISQHNATPQLYKGDIITGGKSVGNKHVGGGFIVESDLPSAFEDAAKEHKMKIIYNKNGLAVLKAENGTNLLPIYNALKSDGRFKSVEIEASFRKIYPM